MAVYLEGRQSHGRVHFMALPPLPRGQMVTCNWIRRALKFTTEFTFLWFESSEGAIDFSRGSEHGSTADLVCTSNPQGFGLYQEFVRAFGAEVEKLGVT